MRLWCSKSHKSTTRWALGGVLAAMAVTLSAATPDSHMGQKISDHVTLRVLHTPSAGVCNALAERIFPSGETLPLEMSGRWFVVTDVTWRTIVGPGVPVQQPGLLTLRIFLGFQNGFPIPFFESSVLIAAESVNDPVFKSEHLTTGFVVDSIPCIEFAQFGNEDGGVSGNLLLHGYLIDRPIVRRVDAGDGK
jgi:hypothetical protein